MQFDIDSDTDFDFDEALANTNKSKMINGGRRDWRLPSTKQSKNVHFFELWDHSGLICFSIRFKNGFNAVQDFLREQVRVIARLQRLFQLPDLGRA